MTNPDTIECAAPGCISNARDGHVCGAHAGTLYADRTISALHFSVVATDPDRDWICAYFRVRALSSLQAKNAVRVELAKEKRDHWSVVAEERRFAA